MHEEHIATIRSWVGRPYSQIRCWDLAVEAYALRGATLPGAYAEALENRMFRTVFEPEPWDIIPICNHELQIVNHVGLYFSDAETIHSFENAGVVSIPLDRQPWFDRIARARDGRRGFLRLR
jgi:cell wall-associated NlpC family hydrolase